VVIVGRDVKRDRGEGKGRMLTARLRGRGCGWPDGDLGRVERAEGEVGGLSVPPPMGAVRRCASMVGCIPPCDATVFAETVGRRPIGILDLMR
jgi:hypothetical protein